MRHTQQTTYKYYVIVVQLLHIGQVKRYHKVARIDPQQTFQNILQPNKSNCIHTMLALKLELASSHSISPLRPRVHSFGPITNAILGLELELAFSDLPHIKLVFLNLELAPSGLGLVPLELSLALSQNISILKLRVSNLRLRVSSLKNTVSSLTKK